MTPNRRNVALVSRSLCRRRRLLRVVACGCVFAGIVRAELRAQYQKEFPPDRSVVYKQVDGVELRLDLFLPAGYEERSDWPAVVFFFGGGWNGGSPSQFYPECRYLAERGMVAMSADYRVKNRNGTSPRECVMDGKSAVRHVRSHAAALRVDSSRLAAGGGSAGGHVAAAVALLKKFDEPGEDTGVSCVPDALILFNPVFDNGPDGYGYVRVKDYWQDVSPIHNITAHAPPTIVLLGTRDNLVPVATAQKFKSLMEAQDSRCELELFEDQPHGFFNYKNRDNYDRAMALVDRFLVSLGYLEPADPRPATASPSHGPAQTSST